MPHPLVSVRVATYNHEKYIARCIESVLMQRTNFPIELVIGEDCSQDRTREIVLSYQEKYPKIIRVVTSETNVGAPKNSYRIQQACRGKYHAMSDGDDYWIDPLKLQKQVDFMEAYPDVTLCFHNAFIVNAETAGTSLFFPAAVKRILAFEDMCEITTPTASVFARSDVLETLPGWRVNILFWGDLLFRLWCAHSGKVAYLDEIMSVYSVHSYGATAASRSHKQTYENEIFLYEQLDKETNYQYTQILQAQAQKVKRKAWRDQSKLYYLWNPKQIVQRVKRYYTALKRVGSVINFGNQE